jgi:hypothetical protein
VRVTLPNTVALIDTVIAVYAANVTLNDTLALPLHVTVDTGRFTYGGVTYHGCAFRHRWTLEVAP